MQTVEIIVFLFAAIIVGGLIILFISDIDTNEVMDVLKNAAFPEKELQYQKIESNELADIAYNLWEKCEFGSKEMSLTVFVSSGQQINKNMLFDAYKKINLCYSIQSKSQLCGNREDVIIKNDFINPPALVSLTCKTSDKTLTIE